MRSVCGRHLAKYPLMAEFIPSHDTPMINTRGFSSKRQLCLVPCIEICVSIVTCGFFFCARFEHGEVCFVIVVLRGILWGKASSEDKEGLIKTPLTDLQEGVKCPW